MLLHITQFPGLLDYSISNTNDIDFAFIINSSNGSLVSMSTSFGIDKISKPLKPDSFASITSKLWNEFMILHPIDKNHHHDIITSGGNNNFSATSYQYDDNNNYIHGGDIDFTENDTNQNYDGISGSDNFNIASESGIIEEQLIARSRSVSHSSNDNENNQEEKEIEEETNTSGIQNHHKKILIAELDEPEGIIAMTCTTNGKFLVALFSSNGKASEELMKKRVNTIRESIEQILSKSLITS